MYIVPKHTYIEAASAPDVTVPHHTSAPPTKERGVFEIMGVDDHSYMERWNQGQQEKFVQEYHTVKSVSGACSRKGG